VTGAGQAPARIPSDSRMKRQLGFDFFDAGIGWILRIEKTGIIAGVF
jgi:hypothetical protein